MFRRLPSASGNFSLHNTFLTNLFVWPAYFFVFVNFMPVEEKGSTTFQINTSPEALFSIEPILEKTLGQEINEDFYAKVLIALTEAVNNAVLHGNKNDSRKKIDIKFSESESYITFKVSDEGEGFRYEHIPNPTEPENITKINGRGIFIMKNLSDDLKFEDGGKTVVLKFQKVSDALEVSQ